MAKGGMPSRTPILGPPKKPFAAGIPFFIGAGQTGPSSMKTGGMVSRAVQSSCKNGMVRGEDGRCVKARPVQFASGGNVKNNKFAALAPPYNKATFADKIVGAKRNAKKK